MVTISPVDPALIPTAREGRRGRVSYPLLKMFLESNTKCAKLEDLPADKNPQYIRSVLFSYINNHKLPIKIFSSGGETYLMRLDMDDNSVVDPDWKWEEKATEGAGGLLRHQEPGEINAAEVAKRANVEQKQITK